MPKRRSNDGYCFIKRRIKPHEILKALENIPYNLLPPTLKKVEDFIKELNITESYTTIPELRISRSLKKYSKKHDLLPLIPYVNPIDKCDYGQESKEMAKNIDIDDLYRGIEDALYEFSTLLHTIKPLINEKGKDIIDNKYPVYHSYPPDKISYYNSELTKLGSEVYNKHYTDFDTAEVLKINEKLDEINEIQKAFKYDTPEYNEFSDIKTKLGKERKILKEKAKEDFKKNVHKFWINEWYDKYAWDFDEEERKKIENPYLEKER